MLNYYYKRRYNTKKKLIVYFWEHRIYNCHAPDVIELELELKLIPHRAYTPWHPCRSMVAAVTVQ